MYKNTRLDFFLLLNLENDKTHFVHNFYTQFEQHTKKNVEKLTPTLSQNLEYD